MDQNFRSWLGLLGVVALAASCGVPAEGTGEIDSDLTGATLVRCSNLTVQRGSIGAGQTESGLATRDLSGTADSWNQYVEFFPSTRAVCTYTLPSSITASSVTSMVLKVNYRGPTRAVMPWSFSVLNNATQAFVPVGDNAFAASWTWTVGRLPVPLSANVVSSNRTIQVQYSTESSVDSSQLDQMVLLVSTTSTDAGTSSVPPPSPAPSPTPSPADTSAPSVPSGLTASAASSSSIQLAWSAATDNVGVTGYLVFRGTNQIASLSGASLGYTDLGLTASTGYSYTVKARDAAGNTSLASASASATTAAASAPASVNTGTVIPLYTDPSTWGTLIQAKQNHPSVPVIAIVDQTDQGPPATCDSNWNQGITSLQAAGITVIAYVDTVYTQVTAAETKSRIDKWKQCYPSLQGVMFDEMQNVDSAQAYYKDVSDYAKSQGMGLTVGNAGTDVPESFFGGTTTDVIFIDEFSGLRSASIYSVYAPHRDQAAVIPYGVPAMAGNNASMSDATRQWVRTVKQSCKYIYVTNDGGANPWDTLSTYFEDLLVTLAEP